MSFSFARLYSGSGPGLPSDWETGYYRTFHVSDAIDPSKIAAEYADGVLVLHLPKAESTRPRRIKVTTDGLRVADPAASA